MQKSNLLVVVMLWCACALGLPAVAEAQGRVPHGKFGLGAEAMITGLTGAAFVYDPSRFRIDALFSYKGAGGNDLFRLAGRVFYVVHSHSAADFSLGGGLGIVHFSPENKNADSEKQIHLEAVAQIRAFIVPQVALSGTLGIGAVFEDPDDSFNIDGTLTGGLGFVYFF